jgi:alkylhydroperoxidase family enzyme
VTSYDAPEVDVMRIPPLEAPFEPETEAALTRMMPAGVPPIALFRTFAHNLAMTKAMHTWGSYELSKELSLSLRDREIVIDRTCARCGCEYEWGVHVAWFAERAALDDAQIASLAHGSADDPCWTSERDRLLIRAVDALHDSCDVPGRLWAELTAELDREQLLDLTMLCGWYHAISFTAVAARIPVEAGAPRFRKPAFV